jgi:hypothetical protein
MPLPRGQATPRLRESARHFMVTIRWAQSYSTRVLTVNRMVKPRDHASQEKDLRFWRRRSNGANKIHFFLAIGATVRAKDLVEPDRRLAIRVWMFPRIPRQISLRFAGNQAPVDGGYLVLLGDR